MFIDFSLLTEKQTERLLKMYSDFLLENKKLKELSFRKAVKVTPDFLQRFLFENREDLGDYYMDVDSSKYGLFSTYNMDTGNIENYREETIIKEFTHEDFLPSCDHLSEDIIDELNQQVFASTGGNYMRWSDLQSEQEKYENCLLGFHTLENGLTFYGMYGTDDCSFPVFFILYYDGEKLRGYIPREGNEFCKDKNEAWGQECTYFEDEIEREEFEGKLVDNLQNFTYFDFNEIKKDILNAIKVI